LAVFADIEALRQFTLESTLFCKTGAGRCPALQSKAIDAEAFRHMPGETIAGTIGLCRLPLPDPTDN